MALITRISRLFKADMHSLLDALEEPASVLKQAVRDMTADIEGEERALQDLKRRESALAQRLAEHARSQADAAERIDLCFKAGDLDLARAMIRRRLETERRVKLAERESAGLAESRARLAAGLAEKRARLAAIKDKMEGLLAEEETSRPVEIDDGNGGMVSDTDVEIAFLAEQARRRPQS
jgi:phage shock protein A